MIPGGRNCKEIERKRIGSKSERKQSKNRAKNRALRDFATSAKSALCCKTIPQHYRSLYEGISQLRRRFWHTSATSQHRNSHFAAAKRIAKMAFCCEFGVLLRNLNWPLGFCFSYLYRSFVLRKGFQKSERHSRKLFVFFSEPRRPILRSSSPISNVGQISVSWNGANIRG